MPGQRQSVAVIGWLDPWDHLRRQPRLGRRSTTPAPLGHMPADKPAHDSSRHNVRCGVLPGAETRGPNHRGKSIGEYYHRFLVWVLMCDHGSERKAFEGVTGWKCIAAVEEVPASVSFQRPLPAGCDFENFRYNQTV